MEPANPPSPISARRPSQVMGPPPPIASEHGSVRTATGPLRHPKPYTPSDIHSMLEQEQEAMVNRLSRELSQLRHQTTSVASTASSTSTTLNDPTDPHHPSSPYLTGAAHPTASRRHRSSSSLSSSYIPTVQGIRSGSVSGIAPLRDTGVPSQRPGGGGGGGDSSRPGRSREPSLTSRSSEYSLHQPPPPIPVPIPVPQQSDALTSSHHTTASGGGGGAHPSSHRSSLSRQRSPASSISRHEEIVQHRGEWEALKKENEALRQRVRELENRVKKLREGETGTGTGTTATEEKGQDANANAN